MKQINANDINFYYDYHSQESSPHIEPHFHNYYEILYFQKGDAYYAVEGNQYDLTEGDMLLTNPRELHRPVFKSNRPYTRSLIELCPAYLSEFITHRYNPFSALERRRLGTQNKIDAAVVKSRGLDRKMEIIGELWQKNLPESEILIKSHLIQLLAELNQIVVAESPAKQYQKIDDILQYINDHITEPITLDSLSKTCYLNKYHIAHAFKERTGFTVMEYISCKRVMLAKEWIAEGIPLSIAADRAGFNEYSAFYRAFMKVTGVSPSKIKKQGS